MTAVRLMHHYRYDGSIRPCEIIRVTDKRIYFRTPSLSEWINRQEHFVDRAAIERDGDGDVYHRGINEIVYLERIITDGAEGELTS